MSEQEDRWEVLWRAKKVVKESNWVTLDVETTGLLGQVIQWAVCAPDGSLLGQGLIKPTVPVEEEARAIHGITDEMLADAPTFDVVAPQIWRLIENKTVVAYNADFDIACLCTSIDSHNTQPPHRPSGRVEDEAARKRLDWLLNELDWYCAMQWFAVIYGEKHEYYGTYTWKKLERACSYFGISFGDAHNAMSDARATTALVHKLAQLAERELPEGYHPLRKTRMENKA